MSLTKPFLMIQFRTDQGKQLEQTSVKEKLTVDGEENLDIHFLDAFDPKNDELFAAPALLLSQFQGVILGGSSEFYFAGNSSLEYERQHQEMLTRLKPFVDFLLNNDFPTLGICFGHQFLAYSLGVEVAADPEQAETGSLSVRLSSLADEDPLFSDMPKAWKAFFIHRDSVKELPQGAVLLGSGERSQVGAFRYKKRIYGIQFHPELDKHDLPPRLQLHPEYVTNGVDSFLQSLEEVPHARQILRNFVRMCITVNLSVLSPVHGHK